jgi:hypothetical protein
MKGIVNKVVIIMYSEEWPFQFLAAIFKTQLQPEAYSLQKILATDFNPVHHNSNHIITSSARSTFIFYPLSISTYNVVSLQPHILF